MGGVKHNIIGVMSGTSLDGVDVAACQFWQQNGRWQYRIETCRYFSYELDMEHRLQKAPGLNARDFALLHAVYGRYLGKLVSQFIAESGFKPDLIASHGYTVFHEPQNGFTTQIGSGAHIAAESGFKVVCDFRTTDVALGGNGAPLVPIGDELMFPNYSACLNLGGFSNISFNRNGKRLAFDICPVNLLLNLFASEAGHKYDAGGQLGKSGVPNAETLHRLNSLGFYKQPAPKSLGREFVETEVLPCFNSPMAVSHKLATAYEHIVCQLAAVINGLPVGEVLVTGGGAHNTFLVEHLQNQIKSKLVVPSTEMVDFKEALIFAFLGLLRHLETPNCLATVTGAKVNNCGGAEYLP